MRVNYKVPIRLKSDWDFIIQSRQSVCPSVRPCVCACVPKILNDYPLYFSEILHGVTNLYGGKCNILGFLKIIVVASPGALLRLQKPQNALKWLKMTLFAL